MKSSLWLFALTYLCHSVAEGNLVKKRDNTVEAFFELLRAGLWEENIELRQYGDIDYALLYKLAEEQSIIGIIAAGLEHVIDIKPPKELGLIFAGMALQLEQRNLSMNSFLAELVTKMRKMNIYALLVKGQGIAQYYERPLWRASGDIDFLFSNNNYQRAVNFLSNLASSVDDEITYKCHQAMVIDSWDIDLHGSMRTGLWVSIDKAVDNVQKAVFYEGKVKLWMDGNTQIFTPGIDEDLVIVFSHILQHFYKEGVGLRQVCDCCRLLWSYRDSINSRLLESRLKAMHVMSEWKSFAAYLVNYLGFPRGVIPCYTPDKEWEQKAHRINSFILQSGNFGHNTIKSYRNIPVLIRKFCTACDIIHNSLRHFLLFPSNSIKTCIYQLWIGLKSQF